MFEMDRVTIKVMTDSLTMEGPMIRVKALVTGGMEEEMEEIGNQ
jgi:hypothetical protein